MSEQKTPSSDEECRCGAAPQETHAPCYHEVLSTGKRGQNSVCLPAKSSVALASLGNKFLTQRSAFSQHWENLQQRACLSNISNVGMWGLGSLEWRWQARAAFVADSSSQKVRSFSTANSSFRFFQINLISCVSLTIIRLFL